MTAHKIRTCLWFDNEALPAAEFYCALLPGSAITGVTHSRTPDGSASDHVLIVEFALAGTPYQGLNGGPMFPQTEAASIVVSTADQAETDRLWAALSEGGTELRCGWLKDRWGVSWQIVPEGLGALLGGPDAAKVMPVFMEMVKIDMDRLEAAARA